MAKLIDVQKVMDHITKWASTKPVMEMSIELNVSPSCVAKYARQMRIEVKKNRNVERTEEIRKAVLIEHNERTVMEFARMFGVSKGSIQYHGRMQGVEFKEFSRARAKKKEPVAVSEFFNPDEREDWFI